jgi:hypothetical protein
MRRCIRLEIPQPDSQKLAKIVQIQIGQELTEDQIAMVEFFRSKRDDESRELATDQLLNAIHILTTAKDIHNERKSLLEALLKSLSDD